MRREFGQKKLLVFVGTLSLICTFLSAFSQKETKNNFTGGWSDNNSWVDNAAIGTINLPTPVDFDITIYGYINVGSYGSNQDLTFAANRDLYNFIVNDTLVVYGNVDFANKAMNLVIGSGGLLIVLGNLNMDNKIDIASDGILVVQGTFNKTGSQGTYTGSGNVYAGAYAGDASTLVPDTQEKNTGSDLSSDLPAVWEFLGGGGNLLLPVVLTNFSGVQVGNSVFLSWTTATERNNDYFTVERSKDGIFFESIGKVDGIGTSNQSQSYEFLDTHPFSGISYYRLKQTDFDGITETFRPIYISHESSELMAMVYPNPSMYDELNISLTGTNMNSPVKVRILNANGYVVLEKDLNTGHSINHLEKLDVKSLPSGYYIIKLINDKFNMDIKWLHE